MFHLLFAFITAGILTPLLSLFLGQVRLAQGMSRGFAIAHRHRGRQLDDTPVHTVWVLSAARDERQRLPEWSSALRAQLLPEHVRLRAVLVDDGSVDGSGDWARLERERWSALTLLETEGTGKIAALQQAIQSALSEGQDPDAVLFTDADCAPAAGWVQSHLEALHSGCGLVGGHVVLDLEDQPGNRTRLLESTLSSLQSAIGAVNGTPPFQRGGNWSTRLGLLRSATLSEADTELGSGDDLLLPRRLLDAGALPGTLLGRASWVHAKESSERGERKQARIRRNAKWGMLPRGLRFTRTLSVIALLAYMMLPLIPGFLEQMGPIWSITGVATVALAIHLLRQGLRLYEMELRMEDPLRLLALAWWALRGLPGGAYTWKGRKRTAPRT